MNHEGLTHENTCQSYWNSIAGSCSNDPGSRALSCGFNPLWIDGQNALNET